MGTLQHTVREVEDSDVRKACDGGEVDLGSVGDGREVERGDPVEIFLGYLASIRPNTV